MKSLSSIANVILHPVTLAIPGVFLTTYNSTRNFSTSLFWTLLSMIFSGIIAVFVLIGVKKGFFNNLDVSNRKQRIILYPFSIVVILFFALFVYLENGPFVLMYASIFFVIALGILDLVNQKIKASIHVAAVASIVTGTIFVYGGMSFILLLFIPLISWARIHQKRHTLKETVAGAICGISFTLIAIFIVQFIIR